MLTIVTSDNLLKFKADTKDISPEIAYANVDATHGIVIEIL